MQENYKYWISIRTIFLLGILCFCNFAVIGQSSKKEFETIYSHLNNDLEKRRITKNEYAEKADSITERLLTSGVKFENTEFLHLLENFREIIWSKSELEPFRSNYYRYLMNNSMALNRPGEMIFFAEKFEDQLNKEGRKSISTAYLKLIIWARSGNNKKVIELYNKERDYLKGVNKLVPNNQTFIEIGQTHQFYFYTLQVLVQEQQNTLIEEVMSNLKILDDNLNNFKNSNDMRAESFQFCKYLQLFSQIEYKFYKNDLAGVKTLLAIASQKLNNEKTSLNNTKLSLEEIYNNFELKLCLINKDHAKAELFYEKIGNAPPIFNDQRSSYFESKSRLLATLGDFRSATNLMDSAMVYQKKDVQSTVEAYENLLYAHIESEYNKLELQSSMNKSNQLRNWIFVLIGIVFSISGFAFFSVLRERYKSKKRIAALNNMTEIAVNEAMLFATREEQKKIGQDLHDDFSGSLLSVINQLEAIKQNESNGELAIIIGEVSAQASMIYNSVRNKSHAIYNKADDPQNDHFDDNLVKIINSAMPDSVYKVDVDIAKAAIGHLNMNQRIQILRIIQEAIANIIKYSKASEVSVFLFLKDDQSTVLQISDNGVGFDKSILQNESRKGLGLRSILNRVNNLGGIMDIINEGGTSLVIQFKAQG